MQSKPKLSKTPTRQRLLDAAAVVFARDGLAGSTTREIAREAGVNEVTLFRHFQTKDRLIAAVVGENFSSDPSAGGLKIASTRDLRADLQAHARRYDALLTENIALIRTMIGEIKRHADQERQVFKSIFVPLRHELEERLRAAIDEGALDPETDVALLADLFGGMIFTGVLRRNSPHLKLSYSPASYQRAAVELIVRGASPLA